MRMLVDDALGCSGSQGSPAQDEVRFLKPLLPGETLSGRYTVIDKRELRSKWHRCYQVEIELLDGTAEPIIEWNCQIFMRLRASSTGGPA